MDICNFQFIKDMKRKENVMLNKLSLSTTKSFLKWSFLGIIIGILCGIASAIFLHSLEWVTNFRENNNNIIYFLPFAGVFTSFLYLKFGKLSFVYLL